MTDRKVTHDEGRAMMISHLVMVQKLVMEGQLTRAYSLCRNMTEAMSKVWFNGDPDQVDRLAIHATKIHDGKIRLSRKVLLDN